jgi:Fic/DOC family
VARPQAGCPTCEASADSHTSIALDRGHKRRLALVHQAIVGVPMSDDNRDDTPVSEEPRETLRSGGWDEASLDAAYVPIRGFHEWADIEVDHNAWKQYLDEYKAALGAADPEAARSVERRIGREAAAETGAVEDLYRLGVGQTRTIAVESPGWEQALGEEGARALDAFNSQFEVYGYVRDAATEDRPMTASFVRELHTVVCRRQETYTAHFNDGSGVLLPIQVSLAKGTYKDRPNHVIRRDGTAVAYAPVNDTEPEMRRLIEEMNGEAFSQAHPVLQAAYVHHGLAHIHPFADGNGRIARALASFFSYRSTGLPLVIYSDRKLPYLQALEAADRGELGNFAGYLCDRLIDTMARATQELRALAGPALPGRLDELVAYITQQRELTIESATKIGDQLIVPLNDELRRLSDLVPDESGIKLTVTPYEFDSSISDFSFGDGFRSIRSSDVRMRLDRPAEVTVDASVGVAVAQDLSSRFAYRIVARTGRPSSTRIPEVPDLDLRFEDVYPSLSTAGHARIVLLAEALVGWLVDKAKIELRKVLYQAGYDSFS